MLILLILVAVQLLCATTPNVAAGAFHMEVKYPCAFIDTVNITGSYADTSTNMSYIHDWTVIPRELVAVYDFVIQNGQRLPAERHLRACICKLKPCIRFCCAEGHFYDVKNRTCIASADSVQLQLRSSATSDSRSSLLDQRAMSVRQANGTTHSVDTSVHFTVHIGTPCEQMRFIMKENRVVPWTLYENGTIAHRNHIFSKHYCYSPLHMENSTWMWQPLACAPEKLTHHLGVKEWTYAICLIIAVICMVINLFVHLFCTELRNTFYGVAIKAYSLCIIIGYSLLAHLTLTDPADMSKFACGIIPSCAVLYLVLAFYILSFISFNFHLNFHGIILKRLMFWLIFFPIVLMAVAWSLFVGYGRSQQVFGSDICWFDPRNLSIMTYFNAPIFVACAICGFFYILTLIRISERQLSEVNKLTAGIEKNRFQSFWKFFGYTFVSWLVCVISFIFNYYRGEKTHINYAVCLSVALHGFGALHALVGKNRQIQNFLQSIEEDVDNDEFRESAAPMTNI